MRTRLRSLCSPPLVAGLLLASIVADRAAAQCSTQWLPGDALAGTDGGVRAMTPWDPDGPGPLSPRLVVAGRFTVAGAQQARRIATYDPQTGVWAALGTGMDNDVYAVTVLPNGDLVAGGIFTTAGGVPASSIARWNGTSWSALGSGIAGGVTSMTTLPNGDVVAGGFFTRAGGVVANYIARWDGTSWSALGLGLNGNVEALVTMPNGDVIAGGTFTVAGSGFAYAVARWDGTNWFAVDAGFYADTSYASVHALIIRPNGELVAGGSFSRSAPAGANNISRWTGTTWMPLGFGVNGPVRALANLPNGDLAVGGLFDQASGIPVDGIANWNGSGWSSFTSAPVPVQDNFCLAMTTMPNGACFAGGDMKFAGSVPVANVASWNGTRWASLTPGTNARVHSLASFPDGRFAVGGEFQSIGGVTANRIAVWNGSSWSSLGSGIDGVSTANPASPVVYSMACLRNGDLVAGGSFLLAGNLVVPSLARWNGANWSAIGTGLGGQVLALAEMPNGDLVAGGTLALPLGTNNVARWNGTSWSPMGPGLGGIVSALTISDSGDLIAGGNFLTAGGVFVRHVARWDGTSWVALGAGFNSFVDALAKLPNGDLVACGDFVSSGTTSTIRIARWNGSSWLPLGTGLDGRARSLAVLPNGDLVVSGDFRTAGGVAANRIARWDGASWSPIGTGLDAAALELSMLPSGELAVGGSFTIAGGNVSAYLARLTTTCPASTSVVGTGCSGSAGPVQLTTTALPWLGSSFVARGTGFPANAIGLFVLGLSQVQLPLSAVHPAGLTGCELRTQGEMGARFLFPAAGETRTTIQIPNDAALIGLVVRTQMASIEPGLQTSIGAIASTNAIDFTVGRF